MLSGHIFLLSRHMLHSTQVKNHMWLFVSCLIENPTFDSQTKENMTLQQKSFGSTCPLSEKFVKQVLMEKHWYYILNIRSVIIWILLIPFYFMLFRPHPVVLWKVSWTGWSSRLSPSSTRNAQLLNIQKSKGCQNWTMPMMQVLYTKLHFKHILVIKDKWVTSVLW